MIWRVFGVHVRRCFTDATPPLIVSELSDPLRKKGDFPFPDMNAWRCGAELGTCQWILNRSRARNAFSLELIDHLEQAVKECRDDGDIRCLVISSSKPGIFSAGADLKERVKMTPEEASHTVNRLRKLFHEISILPFPTIAAIDGPAYGGGAELAIACDLRIGHISLLISLNLCNDPEGNHHAEFSFPETRLGVLPGAGGTQRLSRLIGPSRAKDAIFTGRTIHNEESLGIGLLTGNDPKPVPAALKTANEICLAGPIAIRMAKKAIDDGLEEKLVDGLEIESKCYDQILHTKDRLEGLQAFQEKREPSFKGL